MDVLIHIYVFEHHNDFPLAPHLIHYMLDNFCAQHLLSFVLKGKVNQNLLDLVELIQHMLGFQVLFCTIKEIDFLLP